MELQLIRNATMRLRYAGRLYLTDPLLGPKHSLPSFAGKSPNPLVDLPVAPEAVFARADLVLLSHLHRDHFDPVAQQILPKDLPILCQPGDEARLATYGFTQVTPLADTTRDGAVTITRVPGQHGSGKVLDDMGAVSGFVLQAPGEPTVYWAGDTIWCDAVADTLAREQPRIIITHSAGAVWGDGGLIIMDAAQTIAVCRAAPASIVVAIHLDAFDHATVSRADLRAYANAAGIPADRLRIPADGATLALA
ncbi:MAG TPA: MBL fold metallo-hydrolase [Ktedonobacterales bacterium]|nr:MBL fold metallo-hydrolase [Ktedonobacterales bacterium]